MLLQRFVRTRCVHSVRRPPTIRPWLPAEQGDAIRPLGPTAREAEGDNQPVAIPGFAAARAGEAGFWVFAAAGAVIRPPLPDGDAAAPGLRWLDIGIALIALGAVRLLVPSIPLHFR